MMWMEDLATSLSKIINYMLFHILFWFAAHFVYKKANHDIWKEYKHIKGGCYKYMAYEYKHIARVAHE